MTNERMETLIQELDRTSRTNPKGYRVRVMLLATFAFFLAVAALALSAALTVAAFLRLLQGESEYARPFVYLALLDIALLVSFWVKLDPPEGILLAPQDFPRLFGLIGEVSTRLGSVQCDHVLLTERYNAGMYQFRRYGLLGPRANYLILGLPLMQSLSPEQFKSVIAHEFGHLAGDHGRFNAWVYQVFETWNNLRDASSRHGRRTVWSMFCDWYLPYLGAYSFVLRRAHEYEADRAAGEAAGRKTAAGALLAIEQYARALDEGFWEPLNKTALTTPEPPSGVYDAMALAMKQPITPANRAMWLSDALSGENTYADVHPCLRDRLANLGYRIDGLMPPSPQFEGLSPVVEPSERSAAEAYLGDELPALTACLDARWRASVARNWAERFAHGQRMSRELSGLEAQGARKPLPEKEALEQVRLTFLLKDRETAERTLHEFLHRYPNNARGRFLLGDILLDADDEDGIAEMECAMLASPDATGPACEAVYRYLMRHGEIDRAREYGIRARGRYALEAKAGLERATIKPNDAFEPHGLAQDIVARLQQIVLFESAVREAYLVRKSVRHMRERTLYCLGVVVRKDWTLSKDEANREWNRMMSRIAGEITFVDACFVVALDGGYKPALARIRAIPGALIYKNEA